ncbi:hypothetical protein [Aquibacillus rhizosphaerae]|uniref:Uncharacterized protein n=1 Tax=Aquibacillus rhizosphaerae TaxID=3051431 RepID=A0ABT7L3C9_9BACI|nr:hypothetical protein [Aquibacillus sp. LR5S19]MDL4840378.1 hypothetical protein [Aquibacillus sp. LR5S19]
MPQQGQEVSAQQQQNQTQQGFQHSTNNFSTGAQAAFQTGFVGTDPKKLNSRINKLAKIKMVVMDLVNINIINPGFS